jgi:hypothetical protein
MPRGRTRYIDGNVGSRLTGMPIEKRVCSIVRIHGRVELEVGNEVPSLLLIPFANGMDNVWRLSSAPNKIWSMT